jgi:sugar phosphate isomerase/epimerase
MKETIRSVQVCIPFQLLKGKYLPMVLENRINPEIGISGEIIDTHSRKAFVELASLLHQEALKITLHGPFFDLVPGGMDKKILRATRERLREAFDLIPVFEPMSIVCHTGYDRKRYGDMRDRWLETAVETWTPLIRDLEGTGTVVVLENVYEKTPRMMLKLLNELGSEKAGFCFDGGHMNVFSETDLSGWIKAMAPFLKQLHLHDNSGTRDDHLAIGAGNIDFDLLFACLEQYHLTPIVTLEAHEEEAIWQSLEALSRSERFRRMVKCREESRAASDL